jgi:hypothetical protein
MTKLQETRWRNMFVSREMMRLESRCDNKGKTTDKQTHHTDDPKVFSPE